jgi:hypothetical protein
MSLVLSPAIPNNASRSTIQNNAVEPVPKKKTSDFCFHTLINSSIHIWLTVYGWYYHDTQSFGFLRDSRRYRLDWLFSNIPVRRNLGSRVGSCKVGMACLELGYPMELLEDLFFEYLACL